MKATSRLAALGVLGTALAFVACGGSDLSPVASTTTTVAADENGVVTSSGNGPGTGTCPSDCDGTAQGPGAGAGYGPGPANGGGSGNGYGPGPGPSDGFCGNACTGPVGPDPSDIVEMLQRALQEEYRAEMLYRSVLAVFGADTVPFALIAESEARHVAALQQLFARRALVPPASIWSPASFPTFDTVPLACAAGVTAEREDASFYDEFLPRADLPQDVRNVFTNLQAASLQNHLPAFERCQ